MINLLVVLKAMQQVTSTETEPCWQCDPKLFMYRVIYVPRAVNPENVLEIRPHLLDKLFC